MADFMIRFLICNVFISGIIGILLIAKRIFKDNLSSRMQYNLWFLLLGLLTFPFIPFRLAMCSSRMTCFRQVPIAEYGTYSFVQNTIL